MVLPRLGHMLPLEAPEVVAAAITEPEPARLNPGLNHASSVGEPVDG